MGKMPSLPCTQQCENTKVAEGDWPSCQFRIHNMAMADWLSKVLLPTRHKMAISKIFFPANLFAWYWTNLDNTKKLSVNKKNTKYKLNLYNIHTKN